MHTKHQINLTKFDQND